MRRRLVLGFALVVPSFALGQGSVTGGAREILALSFASAQPGAIPSGLRLLNGTPEVIDKDGVRALRATGPTEFAVALPEALPTDFTIEFDLVPKECGCGDDDLAFDGTSGAWNGSSIRVYWSAANQMVSGEGRAPFTMTTPPALSEKLPGQLTRIVASFEGNTLKLYTNGQRLYTVADRRFARGNVLRVLLGGKDEEQSVYLVRLRVAAGAASTVVATSALPANPSGSIVPMAATPAPQPPVTVSALPPTQSGTITPTAPPAAPPPAAPPEGATRRDALQVLSNGPAPTGLKVSGTPGVGSLTWTAASGATGYEVRRAPLGTTNWTMLTTAQITQTKLSNDLLPDPFGKYTYEVLAHQSDGRVGAATVDYSPPPPADPTEFAGISTGPAVVKLSWAAAWAAKAYLLSGPGIPAGTQVSAPSLTVSSAPPGLNVYRIATVYDGGVLTSASSWPSVTVPVSSVSMLTLPNGPGSLADYNRHMCNAGKWISTQQLWVNTWCDLPTAQSMAGVWALPLLSLFEIQEYRPGQGKNFLTGAPFDIFEPASEWTIFSKRRWAKANQVTWEAQFEDVTDLGRGRRVGCVSRGSGASAATLCWARSSPYPDFAEQLSVIVQTAQETSFFVFHEEEQRNVGCPNDWWDDICAHLVGHPHTRLDTQGDRFVPHSCLACHGGQYDPATGKVTGASLLALNPRGFTFGQDPRSRWEEPIRQINLAIFNAPVSAGVREYITNMYRARQTVVGATVDAAYVPPGWVDQPVVYRDVYLPYCASCHSAQTGPLGFRFWGDLFRERARVQRSVCSYTMPHAELPFRKFWMDGDPGSRRQMLLTALGYSGC